MQEKLHHNSFPANTWVVDQAGCAHQQYREASCVGRPGYVHGLHHHSLATVALVILHHGSHHRCVVVFGWGHEWIGTQLFGAWVYLWTLESCAQLHIHVELWAKGWRRGMRGYRACAKWLLLARWTVICCKLIGVLDRFLPVYLFFKQPRFILTGETSTRKACDCFQ